MKDARQKGLGSHEPGQANKPLSKAAHSLTSEQLAQEIVTNIDDGLTPQEAQERLNDYGTNDLGEDGGVNAPKIFLRQVANAMVLVLILSMAVSFGIKSYIEGGVIAGVIAINIGFGFVEEYKAEKNMSSLRSLSSPTAKVLRDGKAVQIPTKNVVPGDMVELGNGDTIPADVRLIEAVNFTTDEALLTGESLPVEKNSKQVFEESTGPGDRLNIAYSSSTVTKGRARGIVFATGMYTQVGSIAAALRASGSKKRAVKRKDDGSAGLHRYAQAWILTLGDAVGRFLGVNVGTPLQKKLSRLAILLFGIAVVCAIIVLAANNFAQYADLVDSDPEQEVAIYAVATGLSMIPACLIVVLTITMAAGTKVMVKRHVIVRKLNALEALGGVTDICSDKTGTLTQGKMIAQKAWLPSKGTYSVGESSNPIDPTIGEILFSTDPPSDSKVGKSGESRPRTITNCLSDNPSLESFLRIASLANLADIHHSKGEWKARGDPTEVAIQVFACRFGWNRRDKVGGSSATYREVMEFPFDSDVKKMTVILEESANHRNHVLTKGAVERVLDCCTSAAWSEGPQNSTPLNDVMRNRILEEMEAIASLGLRCLALASRSIESVNMDYENLDRSRVESNLVFEGLIGLYDPPRPESAGAVALCHQAGIQVHMLTGDHAGTATAIAKEVGILPSRMELLSKDVSDAMVMTALQFDSLSDEEIDNLPVLPLVVARCAPQTKVRMIEALHRRKKFCAMTGDGVNDSPSLKRADVGIAMGQSGSDVAKDASDIILTDDNFASILNAIEEGRRMFDNIQKFVLHLLALNVAQACVLLIGLAFKDTRGLSVFPLSPVEILWLIMVTAGFPDMGLGFERAEPNILRRPPVSIKKGIFTWEILCDMIFYGLWIAALCLGSFSLVVWGFGAGNLGSNCNKGYNLECDTVFRARGTNFACLTWFALFLAWEVIDVRRSFFRMQPGSPKRFTQWIYDVWRNKVLFCSVVAGFLLIFPLLYIPVINHDVFVHEGISWEWGIVFISSILFFIGAELWKYGKRVFFRYCEGKRDHSDEDGSEDRAFEAYIKHQGTDLSGRSGRTGSQSELEKGVS